MTKDEKIATIAHVRDLFFKALMAASNEVSNKTEGLGERLVADAELVAALTYLSGLVSARVLYFNDNKDLVISDLTRYLKEGVTEQVEQIKKQGLLEERQH